MAKDNVIPFRPRPPSDTELETYRTMTRNWHPQMRQLMFPKHDERDQPEENLTANSHYGGRIVFQSSFMLTTVQPFCFA